MGMKLATPGAVIRYRMPDAAEHGVEVPVSVHSYGGGCSETWDTEVKVNDLVAHVTPHDVLVRGEGAVCDGVLLTHPHVARLRFEGVGTASPLFIGRREPGGELVVVKRSLVVR